MHSQNPKHILHDGGIYEPIYVRYICGYILFYSVLSLSRDPMEFDGMWFGEDQTTNIITAHVHKRSDRSASSNHINYSTFDNETRLGGLVIVFN
jgi:hypothetical protein